MDEKNNLNRCENASSGSLSSYQQQRTDSTFASAETSPRGSIVSIGSSSSSISNFISVKDENAPKRDELDTQKLTMSETLLKEHKEKMQKIAVSIREFAFGKDKSQPESPEMESKAKDSSGSQQFSFSLIDKMLARNGESVAKTASPLSQVSDGHPRIHEHAAATDSPLHSNNSTLSAASSSSPNPDFSPFKLLSNEVHSSSTTGGHMIHSLANALSKPTIDAMNTNKIIESLTSLSHKDHEKADPILSAAKNSSTSPSSLPASSREFCMNLNLNLAVAAAATASGPVAIVDNTKPTTFSIHQQYLEHSKFTSNASTSSIHNDLKMILEESLNKNQVNFGTPDEKRSELPKPQRVSQNAHNSSNPNAPSQKPPTKIVLTTPAPPDLHATKSSNIDLSKYMKMLIESKSKSLSCTASPKKPMNYRYSREFLYQIRDQRSEFIEQIYPDIFQAYCYCSNGDYWDPEKYFDIIQFPSEIERMQSLQAKQQMQSRTNFKNYQQKMNNKKGKNLYQQKLFGNSTDSPSMDSPQPLQVPKNSPRMPLDSETEKDKSGKQSKNKIKTPKQSKKISTSVLTSLGLAEEMKISSDEIDDSTLLGYSSGNMISSMMNSNNSHADKVLLSLLKSSDSAKRTVKHEKTTAGGKVDLLDMLNKPKNKPMEPSARHEPVDVVKNMFQKESMKSVQPAKPTGPRHFPQIFSVQELEMDQISKMKQQSSKLPTSAQQLEARGDAQKHHRESSHQESGDNAAYKKLLMNLNKVNEPKQPASHLNNLFSKLESKPSQKQSGNGGQQQTASNEGTKILKQLLNLKPATESSAESAKEKKSKRHRHHNKQKSNDQSAHNASQSSDNQHKPTGQQESAQHQSLDKYAVNKRTVDSNAHIEHLLNKINESKHREHKKFDQAKQQKEHFNSLLNKIQGPSTTGQAPMSSQMIAEDKSTDILKWFTKANASKPAHSNEKSMPTNWTSLSEIELMQKQRPLVSFGQGH